MDYFMFLAKLFFNLICYVQICSSHCINLLHTEQKFPTNASFLVQNTSGLQQCSGLCLDFSVCLSISYWNSSCYLNYLDEQSYPGQLDFVPGAIYLQREQILNLTCTNIDKYNKRCENNTCGTGFRRIYFNTGYKCVQHYFTSVHNVAIGRPTVQSSAFSQQPFGTFHSYFAVDNDWSTDVKNPGCSYTTKENDPWWQVDLGFPYLVHHVLIQNRNNDLYAGRLRNVHVHTGMILKTMELFSTFQGPAQAEEILTLKPNQPKTGRYIKISLLGIQEHLTLCEVGVYASYLKAT